MVAGGNRDTPKDTVHLEYIETSPVNIDLPAGIIDVAEDEDLAGVRRRPNPHGLRAVTLAWVPAPVYQELQTSQCPISRGPSYWRGTMDLMMKAGGQHPAVQREQSMCG